MAKIYIDPGHNPKGGDTGANGYGHKEQDITVEIGQRLYDLLIQSGQAVYMSRYQKGDVAGNGTLSSSLQSRAADANSKGADLFVSIHCNAANTKAFGCETYSFPGSREGRELAACIQNYLPQLTGRFDRGIKEASFAVLRNTNMPAVLVETAFIDHYDDSVYLASAAGQQCIAEAIARGICEYLGIDYKGGAAMEMIEVQKQIKDLTDTVKELAAELSDYTHPMIYNYIDENMPSWASPTIEKLVRKGALKGDGNGLHLTEEILRILVINDRMGLYED